MPVISAKIKEQVIELLEANQAKIERAYMEAIEAHNTDRKFGYPISLVSTITGEDPQNYNIKTKISFAVRMTDQLEDQVRTEPDMVDEMENKGK